MSRIYRDYFNQTVLTIPDRFIDVKTGDSKIVSPKVMEEIKYHSENNTLQHFLFSALNEYLHKDSGQQESSHDLLGELLEIKKLLNSEDPIRMRSHSNTEVKPKHSHHVNIKEIEDVLEAFGG